MRQTLTLALRGRNPIRPADILRSGLGALLGIPATGLLAHMVASGHASALPLLVPPIGASAVLAFAVPASPLAQPRAIIGGNMISALVGATCALVFHPHPVLAAAMAVACAIVAMGLLGCLHPPGGAVEAGDHQQGLMLLGGKARALRGGLAERQKPAQLVAEGGQRRVLRARQAVFIAILVVQAFAPGKIS